MRIETTKRELYKFNELSETAQDKAVEELWDINVHDGWWECDGMLDLTEQEMKERHMSREYMNMHTMLFSYQTIYFDIGRDYYIQFSDVQVDDYEVFRKFLRIPPRLWDNCEWNFHIGYARNADSELVIEADFWDGREFTWKQQEIIDRAVGIMNDKIAESLVNLSEWYDDFTSEKAIIETIEMNGYEFTVNGEL